MISDWTIEGRNDHIDVRAHGALQATLKLAGMPDAHSVHVTRSSGVKALPSIPMQAGTELVVRFDRVKVRLVVESDDVVVQGGGDAA